MEQHCEQISAFRSWKDRYRESGTTEGCNIHLVLQDVRQNKEHTVWQILTSGQNYRTGWSHQNQHCFFACTLWSMELMGHCSRRNRIKLSLSKRIIKSDYIWCGCRTFHVRHYFFPLCMSMIAPLATLTTICTIHHCVQSQECTVWCSRQQYAGSWFAGTVDVSYFQIYCAAQTIKWAHSTWIMSFPRRQDVMKNGSNLPHSAHFLLKYRIVLGSISTNELGAWVWYVSVQMNWTSGGSIALGLTSLVKSALVFIFLCERFNWEMFAMMS